MPPTLLSLLLVAGATEPAPSFQTQVAPLLHSHCLKCHNPVKLRGGLDLTTHPGMLKGGEAGAVVVPGDSADSLLFAKVRDGKMPPDGPLADAEVGLLRRWIDAGAAVGRRRPYSRLPEKGRAGPDWWSLQPIRRPAVPDVKNRDWVRNPIDAFILARLEAKGLAPAPEADRRTLIRRVTFDLIGLPPTPEEIDAFLKDDSPDAYEKLVDRLLAPPDYGERWGRHWLDVVRFAESHGYEMNTLRPNAWPYRDYVIQAFNEDRPYPAIRARAAGRRRGRQGRPAHARRRPASSSAARTTWSATPSRRPSCSSAWTTWPTWFRSTGTTFLGLTVGCARCHDHKFDPIAQKDFYGLQAVFAGVEHGRARRASRRRRGPPPGGRVAAQPSWPGSTRRLDELEPLAAESGAPAKRPPVSRAATSSDSAAVEARYVRFTVAATTDGTEPCIDELEVYGPDAPADNLALASRGGKATASSVYPNNPFHKIEHLNDGRIGNSRSWISNERGKGWAQVELPKAATIDRVVWGRDREQKYADRLASDYRIEVSTDGEKWTAVAGSWDRLPFGQAPPAPPDELRQVARPAQADRRNGSASLEKATMVYAGTFRKPDPTFVLKRGDPTQKAAGGRAVGRAGRGAGVRAEAGRAGVGTAAGAGRLDRQPGQPAAGPRDGQPRLALALRPGHRADAERLRLQRRPAVAPGIARLAGGRVPGRTAGG